MGIGVGSVVEELLVVVAGAIGATDVAGVVGVDVGVGIVVNDGTFGVDVVVDVVLEVVVEVVDEDVDVVVDDVDDVVGRVVVVVVDVVVVDGCGLVLTGVSCISRRWSGWLDQSWSKR